MLKFEKIAKVNQTIRAYDFKPLLGRTDCFVEGVVLEMSSDAGYKAFKIRVTKDVYDGKEFTEAGYKALGNRVGEFVFVPMQASRDYDARIMNLSE